MGNRNKKDVSLDLIIPVFNEEEILQMLVDRVWSVFSEERKKELGLGRARILFVDDGSTDGSSRIIKEWIALGAEIQLIVLSRNFGHQAAVSAGVDHANADVVAILDADLQDPPELLTDMLEKWRRGVDVIYGVRGTRSESWIKNSLYFFFYRLLSWLTNNRIPNDSGDFCLMDRKVVATLRRLPEKHRFVRGLRAWVGYRQVSLVYDRPPRQKGKTKYTWENLYELATDGIASSSIRPLKISQFTSLVLFIATIVVSGIALKKFAFSSNASAEVLLLYVLIVLVCLIGFANSLSVYVVGAYLGRMYLEVKNRPTYVVSEIHGVHSETFRNSDDQPPYGGDCTRLPQPP